MTCVTPAALIGYESDFYKLDQGIYEVKPREVQPDFLSNRCAKPGQARWAAAVALGLCMVTSWCAAPGDSIGTLELWERLPAYYK